MNWKYFTLIIIFSSSCTLQMGRFQRIVRQPIPSDQIKISSSQKYSKEKIVHDCTHIITIIPTKIHNDMRKLFKNICPPNQQILNAQLSDTFWYIPLIYGKECLELRANCQEE